MNATLAQQPLPWEDAPPRLSREEAEEYTQALGQVVAGGWRQVALGRRLGVPEALGLTTREWVDQRLGGYVRLSIEDRREAVKELTEDGLTTREAASVLGVDQSTVVRDANASSTDETPEDETPEDDANASVEPGPVAEQEPDQEPESEPEPKRRAKSHAAAHEERTAASEARVAARPPQPQPPELLDRIARADALTYLGWLRDGTADACLTSPPYWAKRTYTNGDPRELGQEPEPEQYAANLCAILAEVGRVLTPAGCLFLNLGDTLGSQPGRYRGDPARARGISNLAIAAASSAPAARELDVPDKSFCLIPETVVLRLVLDFGWRLSGKIVWHKVGHQPENVFDRLTQAWEPIYVLTRSTHAYFKRGDDHADVWAIPVGRKGAARGHFAPFPDALVERVLRHACPDGGTVLDPFAGSGTTRDVARRLGYRFLGCDLGASDG